MLQLLPILGVQGQGLPSGFSEKAKDLWGELNQAIADSEKAYLSADTCETRASLLKALATSTAREAPQIKSMVIQDLGLCDLSKKDYAKAKQRFESAISEMNAPSEEMLMQNTQMAPLVLEKDAMVFLHKNEVSRAGIALRRTKAVLGRERSALYKQISKGNKIPIEQVPMMIDDLKKKSKEEMGQNAAQIKSIIGAVNKISASQGLLDSVTLDVTKSVTDPDDKEEAEKNSRLAKSLAGPHLPLIAMKPILPSENLLYADKLVGAMKTMEKEIEGVEKHVALIKRTKEASGCKTAPETCKALKEITDITSNGFGETRILVLKAGKKQTLDVCETNANLGIILPIKGDVSVTIGSEKQDVEKGTAVIVDFCLAGSLEAKAGAHVLFAQAWHPQVAALERTTEIRDRAKKWGISEDDIKEVTKAVNTYAKKEWDKQQKHWAKSPAAEAMNDKYKAVANAKKEEAEKAKEEAEKKAMDEDEERKKGLEQLEQKREKTKKDQEAKEKKRVERDDKRKEEEMKKDPWLRDPVVVAVKAKLEELKEARRDANAKLEFDLTTSLTKEISDQERLVKKMINKARKAHKKGKSLKDEGYGLDGVKGSAAEGDAAGSSSDADDKPKDEPSGGDDKAMDAASIEAELKKVEEKKKKAIADEDFAAAGALKKEKEALEKKLAAAKATKKGNPEEQKKLEEKLKKIEADKAEAIKKEDFKKASTLKKEKEEVEKKLQALKEEL